MSSRSHEAFWSIVDTPADAECDRRITAAAHDLDLLSLASTYNSSSDQARTDGVIYFADGIAEVMERFGLDNDPDAAAVAWDRCRGQGQS